MSNYIAGVLDDSEYWYNQGDALFKLGCYQEALASFDQALGIQPNHYQTWILRGGVLSHLDCYQQALASFEQALALKPNDQTALLFKGVALHHLGYYEEAFSNYDQALGIERKSFWRTLIQKFNKWVHGNFMSISHSSPT
ncbi:MAG TPA: hypothetical protein DCL61_24785 [Cyanobacteria bacterium UBA12227]|nr:hypothetical protein [Cyanobacteria bacterium UBA12227]HAX89207.1 hypothetical protein [Cyanobacteria bacterium UBA11370]HBY76638.1 hypothetical protein [Cyanobacteria bacterium UBA11148]